MLTHFKLSSLDILVCVMLSLCFTGDIEDDENLENVFLTFLVLNVLKHEDSKKLKKPYDRLVLCRLVVYTC